MAVGLKTGIESHIATAKRAAGVDGLPIGVQHHAKTEVVVFDIWRTETSE